MESSNPVFGNAPTLKVSPSAAQVEEIYRTPQRLTMDDVKACFAYAQRLVETAPRPGEDAAPTSS